MAGNEMLAARAESLLASTQDAYERGDVAVLIHYAAKLLEVAQSVGDTKRTAQAYNFLGTAEVYRGKAEAANRYYDQAQALYQQIEDTSGIISVLIARAVIHADILLDFNESRRILEEALRISRIAKLDRLTAFALSNLGETSRLDGDYVGALAFTQESLKLFESLGDQAHAAAQLINIGHYRALRREYEPAMASLRKAYAKLRKQQRFVEIAHYLEIWFFVAFEIGKFEEAAKLLGFLETYRDEHTVPRLPTMMPWFAPRLERLEQRLGYEKLRRSGGRANC
ncbi:MAG: hypothetical protein M3M96_00885 [Candidatus Eremiobacteraeota bacterium]|nr:hypothetical protein [Candidatus Eremiobacteraeota bacterium]